MVTFPIKYFIQGEKKKFYLVYEQLEKTIGFFHWFLITSLVLQMPLHTSFLKYCKDGSTSANLYLLKVGGCMMLWNRNRHLIYFSCHLNIQTFFKDVLFTKISQAISRTTSPNIGLFVFILMHFPCSFQIWT